MTHVRWGRPPGLRGLPWTRLPLGRAALRERGWPARGPAADEGVRPTLFGGQG